MATAQVDDAERIVRLADELLASNDRGGPICLLQCGRASDTANELIPILTSIGRRSDLLVVKDRLQAQSDAVSTRVSGASSVWVFAEDLLEAFFNVFATRLAFELRARARGGMPVVGIGRGALTLGGLLLANRICRDGQFDLISGLGWAPRVMFDGGEGRAETDRSIARTTVHSLPGLLSVDLRVTGGIRVLGGRIESIGTEPVRLLGGGGLDALLMLDLEPGQATTLAPPPFLPFERRMLPAETLRELAAAKRATDRPAPAAPATAVRQPPTIQVPSVADPKDQDGHAQPGSGRRCPVCNKVHSAEAKLELAA
jgi:hypothetical protein